MAAEADSCGPEEPLLDGRPVLLPWEWAVLRVTCSAATGQWTHSVSRPSTCNQCCLTDQLHWLDAPLRHRFGFADHCAHLSIIFTYLQAVCNGPSMSAAQSTTVHERLLHPHLRHCSSPASARWQVTPYHSIWRTVAATPQTLLVASICRVAGNTVPQYMTDCCIHTSDTARRQHLPGGR